MRQHGYCSEPDTSSHTSSERDLPPSFSQGAGDGLKVVEQPHYEIISESGSSSADVIIEGEESSRLPKYFVKSPPPNVLKSPPKPMKRPDVPGCGKPMPTLVPASTFEKRTNETSSPPKLSSYSPHFVNQNNAIPSNFIIASDTGSSSDDVIIEGQKSTEENKRDEINPQIPHFSEKIINPVVINASSIVSEDGTQIQRVTGNPTPPALKPIPSSALNTQSQVPRFNEPSTSQVGKSVSSVKTGDDYSESDKRSDKRSDACSVTSQKTPSGGKKLGVNFKSNSARGRGAPTQGRIPPAPAPLRQTPPLTSGVAPQSACSSTVGPVPAFPSNAAAHQVFATEDVSRGRGRARAIGNRKLAKSFLSSEERSIASRTSSRNSSPFPASSHSTSTNPPTSSKLPTSSNIPNSPQLPTSSHLQSSSQLPNSSHLQSSSNFQSPRSDTYFHSDFYGPNIRVVDDGDVSKSYKAVTTKQKLQYTVTTKQGPHFDKSVKQGPVSLCLASDSDDPDNF